MAIDWGSKNTAIRAEGMLTVMGPQVRVTIGGEDLGISPEKAADFGAYMVKVAAETIAAASEADVEAGGDYTASLEEPVTLEWRAVKDENGTEVV